MTVFPLNNSLKYFQLIQQHIQSQKTILSHTHEMIKVKIHVHASILVNSWKNGVKNAKKLAYTCRTFCYYTFSMYFSAQTHIENRNTKNASEHKENKEKCNKAALLYLQC